MDLLVFGDASITLRGCRLDFKGRRTYLATPRSISTVVSVAPAVNIGLLRVLVRC